MKSEEKHPPAWADRLLCWYCKQELYEDLSGDLHEFYRRNVNEKGAFRANLIFIADVVKFCRPYLIRKPHFINLLIQWIMLNSYIKTSARSIARNKLFSVINIAGLAISLSVGMLMISMLSDLYSYDRFNIQYDRIYRLKTHQSYHENSGTFASTSLKVGIDLKEALPNSESVAILERGLGRDVKAGTKTLPLEGLYANEAVLSLFTFPMISGDPAKALKDPYTAVLTQETARKFFGDTDPVGKTIGLSDTMEYLITGVVKDIPRFSHLRFDYLVSLASRDRDLKAHPDYLNWDNIWNDFVYFILPDNTTPAQIQKTLDRISSEENKTLKEVTISFSLQRLGDIAVGEELSNSIGPVMSGSIMWILIVLSGVVITSACFNYTNLSIARSLRRSREVGIRKVIGARRNNVLAQFIVEAVVIALMALVIAFGFFLLLRPLFLSLNSTMADLLSLQLSARVIAGFIGLGLFTGLIAGFFPALFFTKVNAVQVLKGNNSIRGSRQVTVRKILIIAQYSLSLMLIAATILGYRQYTHLLHFDLGFHTADILNIRLQGVKPGLLSKDISELPEVKEIATSLMITSVGSTYGTNFKNPETLDSGGVYYNKVDEHYIPLHGHQLIAGSNFSSNASGANNNEVIIDEETLKYFNIAGRDPQKAIGRTVIVSRKPRLIKGVMKNYSYGRAADAGRQRIVLCYSNSEANFINVNVESKNWPATMAKIDAIWKKHDDVHPIDAAFYDEQIARAYGEISSMLKIVGFLAFLAIFIASLGMLGMVVLTTETRLKEISIRKVLGASEGNLIYNLSKGFLLLLLISSLIGIPSATVFFEKFIFETTVNKVPVNPVDMLLVVGSVLGIALIMIGAQTLKAARANPAEVLKNE